MISDTPFVIKIDSREKAPWSFANLTMPIKGKQTPVNVLTETVCLNNDGCDYAVKGLEDECRLERKSIFDLFGTMADRESFKRQIAFCDFAIRFTAVIIEASWPEISEPEKYIDDWRSRMNTDSVMQSIHSFRVRYPRVHWLAPGSRREAEKTAFSILRHTYRQSLEGKPI